jgi:hypothetical protein
MLRRIRRRVRAATPGGLEQMTWKPQLNVVCSRCGKPRGLTHTCFSNSRRTATIKPSISFGKCPTCRKPIGNPLTHVCAPKSDFKARKKRAAKQQKARDREKARKKRLAEQHPYESCRDDQCKRPMCVAYRTGWHEGETAGFDAGFQAGLAACPGPHNG